MRFLGRLGDRSGLLEGPIRFREIKHETVFGFANENGAWKHVTLFGCSEIRLDPDLMLQLGTAESTLTPDAVLLGIHLSGREQVFHEFEGRLMGLEGWTRLFVPQPELEFDKQNQLKALSHRFEPPSTASFTLPLRGTLSFPVQFSAGKKGLATYSVTYRTPVALEVDGGATLDWFLEAFYDLQVLLSILMGKAARTVSLKGRARHDVSSETSRPEFDEFQIYIRAQHPWTRPSEQQKKGDELIALPQIESDLQNVLEQWFGNTARFRQAARLYYDNLNQPKRFSALRFLTTAQAVETAHRRLFGESRFSDKDEAGYKVIRERFIADLEEADLSLRFKNSLRDKLRFLPHDALRWRLKDLWNRSEGVLEHHIPNRDGFCEAVRISRDYYTHYGEGVEEQAADGIELAVLTVRLEVMLVTTFLLALGVPAEKVRQAVQDFGEYKWIGQHHSPSPHDT